MNASSNPHSQLLVGGKRHALLLFRNHFAPLEPSAMGRLVQFVSPLGAPRHVSVGGTFIRGAPNSTIVYGVPNACVGRLSPSPLLRVWRDAGSGLLQAAVWDGLPPEVNSTALMALWRGHELQVRGRASAAAAVAVLSAGAGLLRCAAVCCRRWPM